MQRSKNVSKQLPLFILLLLGLLICHACSKDGLNQRLVRVKIETNSDEPVRISAQLQISVAYFCSIGYIFLFNA